MIDWVIANVHLAILLTWFVAALLLWAITADPAVWLVFGGFGLGSHAWAEAIERAPDRHLYRAYLAGASLPILGSVIGLVVA